MFDWVRRRQLRRSLTEDQRVAVEALKSARRALLEENRRSRRLDDDIDLLTIAHGYAAANTLVTLALARMEPLKVAFTAAREECHAKGLNDDQLKLLVGYEFLP
jgi:hypothetical protein